MAEPKPILTALDVLIEEVRDGDLNAAIRLVHEHPEWGGSYTSAAQLLRVLRALSTETAPRYYVMPTAVTFQLPLPRLVTPLTHFIVRDHQNDQHIVATFSNYTDALTLCEEKNRRG